MPTELDTAFAEMALEMVEEFGITAAFTAKASAHSTATMTTTPGADLGDVKVSPFFDYESKYIDGDLIRATDQHFIVPGSGLAFVPEQGQRIAYLGVTYQAVRVRQFWSGEQVAAYDVQVRR